MSFTPHGLRSDYDSLHATASRQRVILIAHGSPDERHAAIVGRIADRMSALTGIPTEPCYLEHNLPRITQRLAEPDTANATVLPLLLTAGYHWREDIPPVVAKYGHRIRLIPPPPLETFAEEIASEVRHHCASHVVVAFAGSRSPDFRDRAMRLQTEVQRRLGSQISVVIALNPAEAGQLATPGSLVIPLVVAPGILGDRITEFSQAVGAEVTPPIGVTPGFAKSLVAYLATTD